MCVYVSVSVSVCQCVSVSVCVAGSRFCFVQFYNFTNCLFLITAECKHGNSSYIVNCFFLLCGSYYWSKNTFGIKVTLLQVIL